MSADTTLEQDAIDFPVDDNGLVIIGPARHTAGTQIHSTFRKIDMSVKEGKYVSLSWGDLMVMLPRPLYAAVLAYATRADQESRAAALATLLARGLAECD